MLTSIFHNPPIISSFGPFIVIKAKGGFVQLLHFELNNYLYYMFIQEIMAYGAWSRVIYFNV